jgi:hypothetical protein
MTAKLRSISLMLATLLGGAVAFSQANPKMFIEAEPQFSTALAAALEKKHVAVTVVLDPKAAKFVLKSAPVNSKDESGAGKIARCMFLDCIGINGNSTVSVELVRSSDFAVVWAYQVRKANSGPLGIQSLSEAIAKHLKKDYLHQETF